MIDPDKKVEKLKKENSNLYQSSEHPEHHKNEGGEFVTKQPNRKEDKKQKDND